VVPGGTAAVLVEVFSAVAVVSAVVVSAAGVALRRVEVFPAAEARHRGTIRQGLADRVGNRSAANTQLVFTAGCHCWLLLRC
jgi:hypothetical protein